MYSSLIIFFLYIASQMWLLGRLIPVLLGKYVAPNNKKVEELSAVANIIDLLFARRTTEDTPGILHYMICEHHSNFISLYILTKMHFLIHSPRIMME